MDTTESTTRQRICIYCDGGFGNRYNALVSGLAIAREVDLDIVVYWPRNNWCGARFQDIFDISPEPYLHLAVFAMSLKQLSGKLAGLTPLLHDEKGAQALEILFGSAYDYDSLDDLRLRALKYSDGLFFYPAIIPPWIPKAAISSAARTLRFVSQITNKAQAFIRDELRQPFYSIHLRRTDLVVGFSDEEVSRIAQSHPESRIFVCSDSSSAEHIAGAIPQVRYRLKSAYVGKRSPEGGWNALTFDDDGRPYHSNIERESESVIEAVIDLLILAHGTIIGYSGSTFQSVARLIGQAAPLLTIGRPLEFPYLALNDCLRQLASRRLTITDLLGICQQLTDQQGLEVAVRLLQAATNQFHGVQGFPIRFNLALILSQMGRHGEAEAVIHLAIDDFPEHLDSYRLAAQVCRATNRPEQALRYLIAGIDRIPASDSGQNRQVFLDQIRETLALVELRNEPKNAVPSK